MWYQIPVKSKIVHELRERIYHLRTSKIIKDIPFFPSINENDLLIEHRDHNGLRIRAHDTNLLILFGFMNISTRSPHLISKEARLKSLVYSEELVDSDNYTSKPIYSQYCKYDSIRSAGFGRSGPLFHDVEYGPFYRLLLPDFTNLNDWVVKSNTKIIVQSKGKYKIICKNLINHIDVTRSVTFGGPNFPKTRLKCFLYLTDLSIHNTQSSKVFT